MKKLSEITGEDALNVLADVLDPMIQVSTDEEFVDACRKRDKSKAIKCLLKNHSKEVLTVLAILDGADVENYNPSIVRIPALLVELFNDPDIVSLFTFRDTVTSSGSATESTEATEKRSEIVSSTRERGLKDL